MRYLILAVALILSSSAFSSKPENLIANGGFENGDGGYTGKQAGVGKGWEVLCGGSHPEIYSLDSKIKHSGKYSQKMTSEGYNCRFEGDSCYCFSIENDKETIHPVRNIKLGNQAIAQVSKAGGIKPGKSYRASVWVKIEGLTQSWEWFRLGIYWLDSDRKFIGEVRESDQNKNNYGAHDWKQVSLTAQAPEKAAYAKVYLHHHFEHGTVWYDDVELIEVK